MINRVGLLTGTASVVALMSVASFGTDLNVWVLDEGDSNAISVSPGVTVNYKVVGELSDELNEGLALVLFDLSLDGASCTGNECDLTPADTPTGEPMSAFVIPDGITNPAGFGGTVIGGDLIQICGGQNTIKNTIDDEAPFPTGAVIERVAWPSSPAELVTGSLTAPTAQGAYTLTLSDLAASVIQEGEDGSGTYWATDLVVAGTIADLTIAVGACVDDFSLCDDENVCTDDDCVPGSGADQYGCVHSASSPGAPCGDLSDTDCDNPNSCDTGGVCQSNYEVSGTACPDEGNACTDDVCDGAGTCSHPNNTAPCDDQTECTSGDACAGGVCVGTYQVRLFGDLKEPFCLPTCPQPDTDDIICVLDDFADGPAVNGCQGAVYSTDLAPCGGNGTLDLDDILAILDGFSQVYACPHPCP